MVANGGYCYITRNRMQNQKIKLQFNLILSICWNMMATNHLNYDKVFPIDIIVYEK
jgi:hypothetical protein